jgi:TRAP-type C4-dicarboxylate transport system permease small subunit
MPDGLLWLERAAVCWTRRLALLGGWLLLAVAFLTVADALLRSFLARPIQGTFEATELVLAAIIFFALPYTGLTDGHVTVDLVTGRLPTRMQHVIVAINALVAAALLGLVTREMAALAAECLGTGRTTITARIPVFPFILPVTAAAGLAALAALVQAAGALARAVTPPRGPAPPFPPGPA